MLIFGSSRSRNAREPPSKTTEPDAFQLRADGPVLRRVFTYLDAQFRILRRAVGRVLTLARKRRVVVVLPRHHPQDGLHRVQRTVVEQFFRRLDAPVQHVPQPVDPRDLQLNDD